LDVLAREPALAAGLSTSERRRVHLQCVVILGALATAPEKSDEEELVEPAEAARRMNVGRSTVYEMLQQGSLRYVQKGKRGKLIPASEIEAWMKKNLRQGAELHHASLEARVAATESRIANGNDKKTPTSIREVGLADRLPRRIR
jgi:excisionase family DNA binding protein